MNYLGETHMTFSAGDALRIAILAFFTGVMFGGAVLFVAGLLF